MGPQQPYLYRTLTKWIFTTVVLWILSLSGDMQQIFFISRQMRNYSAKKHRNILYHLPACYLIYWAYTTCMKYFPITCLLEVLHLLNPYNLLRTHYLLKEAWKLSRSRSSTGPFSSFASVAAASFSWYPSGNPSTT